MSSLRADSRIVQVGLGGPQFVGVFRGLLHPAGTDLVLLAQELFYRAAGERPQHGDERQDLLEVGEEAALELAGGEVVGELAQLADLGGQRLL